MSFPPNPDITMTTADALVEAVRADDVWWSRAQGEALVAGRFGISVPRFRRFLLTNWDFIFPDEPLDAA